jgi:hypothetical protein
MKKLILFTLLCIYATISDAQESKLTGTWIGTYSFQHLDDDDNWFWADYKLYVRIYKYEEYRLKMKTVPASPCSKCRTTYYDNCTITSVDDNTICFYEKSEKDFWQENDVITGMYQIENHYRLSYSNGVLHISPVKRIMIDYDKHGNFLKREDVTHMSAWIFKDVDLYKEETDW